MAGLVTAATPTFAEDPDIATVVEAIPASVTYSTTAVPTFARYRITLTHNQEDEALDPVMFTATTKVFDDLAGNVPSAQTAIFFGTPPSGCTFPTASSISCSFSPGLSVPGSSLSLSVTVKAPSAGAKINFRSKTSWKEGSETESTPFQTASTLLNAPDPSKISSFVPAGGGTLFTGINGGEATPFDTWTTTVTIPGTAAETTADILETVSPITCAARLLDCSTSILAIPGTFSNLLITLRRDASTLAKHAKISSARVFYDQPAHPDVRITYPLEVPACADTTYGVLPQLGIPCIHMRTAYASKSTPKRPVPPGREGDWEFIIKALDNGKYIN